MVVRRTFFRWLLWGQIAGMTGFLACATGAMIVILPRYIRGAEGASAASLPDVAAWGIGVGLIFIGLLLWVVVSVGVAFRINDLMDWVLFRIGVIHHLPTSVRLAGVHESIEAWKEEIERSKRDFLVESAVRCGWILLHEFGNYLTAINVWASRLRWQHAASEDVQSLAAAIRDASAYLDSLRHWVQGNLDRMEPVDLYEVACRAQAGLFKEKHRVRVGERPVAGGQVHVRGFGGLLLAVLNNLILNALEYTRESQADVRVVMTVASHRVAPGDRPQACVILRVEDDGGDLPTEVEERLFEPPHGLALRPSGSHVGLGLPLCRAFIALHNGTLKYRAPRDGQAKAFEITLPLADGATAFKGV
jgi:signal transduction histidine kinase